MANILVLAPHGSYRIVPFLDSCHKLGVGTTLLTGNSELSLPIHRSGIVMDLSDTGRVLSAVRHLNEEFRFRAVIGTDDSVMELASGCAEALNLPDNSRDSSQ